MTVHLSDSCLTVISLNLLLWLSSFSVSAVNYCSIRCDNGEYHTLCKFERTSQYCKEFYQITDVREKSEILRFHNYVRNSFAGGKANEFHPPAANMMLMYWDGELERSALRWAQQCTASLERDGCRDVLRFKVGQNVAVLKGKTAGYAPVKLLLKQWYDQWGSMAVPLLDSYDSEGADVDELTQMLWAKTERVGCADVVYQSADGEVVRQLVCNYGPVGNTLGEPVYLRGQPCSLCPPGTSCLLNSLQNLCAKW